MTTRAQFRGVAIAFQMAVAAAAQGTYIVDAANGPGTSFTDISPAVIAVPDDSVLLVRAGTYYLPVTVHAKAVTILCEPNVSVNSGLIIRNTQPSQRVVVRGLQLSGWPDLGVEVLSAQGPVIIDGANTVFQKLQVVSSPNVVVRSCRIGATFGIANSTFVRCEVTGGSRLVLEECVIDGMSAATFFDLQSLAWMLVAPARPAMQIGVGEPTPSLVMMTNCSIRGGSGAVTGSPWTPSYALPRSAIELGGGSTVRIAGTPSNWVWGGTGSGSAAAAVIGSGSARIDPAVVVDPVPVSTPTLSIARPVLPAVSTAGGAVGAPIVVTRLGQVGIPFAVAIGWLGQPSVWTGGLDPLWLDPNATFVEAFAGAATSPFTLQKPVPNLQSLRGLTIAWQAVDFDLGGDSYLSNPSVVVIR